MAAIGTSVSQICCTATAIGQQRIFETEVVLLPLPVRSNPADIMQQPYDLLQQGSTDVTHLSATNWAVIELNALAAAEL